MVEAGTPNTLLRRGFTKESLLPGTIITVDGYQSKDRTNRANGRDLTFADGKKLFLGSHRRTARWEGSERAEKRRPEKEIAQVSVGRDESFELFEPVEDDVELSRRRRRFRFHRQEAAVI